MISEKLMCINEYIKNKNLNGVQSAAFKVYIKLQGEKPYKSKSEWEKAFDGFKNR